jgi:hypothetical protein
MCFHMFFLLPKMASTINITAAATKRMFIKAPPIRNNKPNIQKNTTNPPIHLKIVIRIVTLSL